MAPGMFSHVDLVGSEETQSAKADVGINVLVTFVLSQYLQVRVK